MRKVIGWILLLALLLCGCGKQEAVSEATQPQPTEPVVTEPTEPETEPPTEPEPTEPPVQLHSGMRADGSFDAGTVFVGDSLTYGLLTRHLKDHNLRGECRYMAIPGGTLSAFFDGPKLITNGPVYCFFSKEFEGMYMSEAIEAVGEEATAIYFMMGTNYSYEATDQTYIDIVTHMLEKCPNATVYLQLVPYAATDGVEYKDANRRVMVAYNYFVEQEEPRVQVIDTMTAIGYNQTTDGVHLTDAGNACWYEALVAYAQENNIPQ